MGMNQDPDMGVLDNACAALDGRDDKLLQWISDSGIAALCADNYAVEHLPATPAPGRRPGLPLHQHCLFKLGVPAGRDIVAQGFGGMAGRQPAAVALLLHRAAAATARRGGFADDADRDGLTAGDRPGNSPSFSVTAYPRPRSGWYV